MSSSMPSLLDPLAPSMLTEILKTHPKARRWWVAFSGGIDSHVLLHLCQEFIATQVADPPQLLALHVDHQLQEHSADWVEHCRQRAVELTVTYHSLCVEVDSYDGNSLEERARNARYQCFESMLGEGDVLLLGHHRDDQAETLLLRLLRGSGVRGLAAMPVTRPLGKGYLHRPLMACSRVQIEQYAKQHRLHWVEDPSNQRLDFDRNFLRWQLLPRLAERWPQYTRTLSRVAEHNREAHVLTQDLAAMDCEQLGFVPGVDHLTISSLQTLSPLRQKNVLRYWFEQRNFPMPSTAQLGSVLSDVVSGGKDSCPLVRWAGVEVRRFEGKLFAMSPLTDFDTQASYEWSGNETLHIEGVGKLSAAVADGKGLRCCPGMRIQFRQGGERCRPLGRGGSRALKKLLQELGIPPWLRDRVPLIYCGDELIAVADHLVCEGWEAAKGEQGLILTWRSLTNG